MDSWKNKAYHFYHNRKNQDSVFITLFVFLAVAKIFGYIFYRLSAGLGLPHSADSQWYLDYAHALANNFKIGSEMNDIMYFGYNTLLAALLAVFKDPLAIVFIQAAAAGLSVIFVYKIAKILFNRATAVIASLFYCLTKDITLWSMYILSDSFFVSLLLACVYFLLMSFESGQRKYKLLFAAASLYLMVFRPTGIAVIAVILVYIAFRLGKKKIAVFFEKKLFIGISLTVAVLILSYLCTSHKLDPLINSLQYNAKLVLYNVYAKGWIYDKPTDFDHFFRPDYKIDICNSLVLSFVINNWEHVLIIYAKRAIAFLGVWTWGGNIKTVLGFLMFVYNLFLSALFFAGTLAAVKNNLFKKASVLWLIILAIFAFCVLLFIDAMYRYRFPAIPFIIIVTAYGADRIIQQLKDFKKYTGMFYGKRENINRSSGF